MFTEYVVSGSCADLIKLAMLKVDGVLPDRRAPGRDRPRRACLRRAGRYRAAIRDVILEVMIEAFVEMFGTEIPVDVEAKVCANWGEK